MRNERTESGRGRALRRLGVLLVLLMFALCSPCPARSEPIVQLTAEERDYLERNASSNCPSNNLVGMAPDMQPDPQISPFANDDKTLLSMRG